MSNLINPITYKEEWLKAHLEKVRKLKYTEETCNHCDKSVEWRIFVKNPKYEAENFDSPLTHACDDHRKEFVADFKKHGYLVKLKRLTIARVEVEFT